MLSSPLFRKDGIFESGGSHSSLQVQPKKLAGSERQSESTVLFKLKCQKVEGNLPDEYGIFGVRVISHFGVKVSAFVLRP